MPRLLALLPSVQAIISKEDGTVSLITVMQGVTAAIPEDAVGQNVLLPHPWAVFAYWMKQVGEEGVTFEQRTELIAASGDVLLSQTAEFVIAKTTHSQIGRVAALPVPNARAGEISYTIRVAIRRAGESDFATAGEFPLTVVLNVVASAEAASR